MKASDLVAELGELVREHGDCEVTVWHSLDPWPVEGVVFEGNEFELQRFPPAVAGLPETPKPIVVAMPPMVLGSVVMSPEEAAEHTVVADGTYTFNASANGVTTRHVGVRPRFDESGNAHFALTEETVG